MRLQRQISRQIEGNEYSKWVIIVPPSLVEELGWQEGAELHSFAKGKTLVIELQTTPKEKKPSKMPYEEFRERILAILKTKPEGLSWTEIRSILALSQKVPNNLWVRMMEKDVNLIRNLDHKTGKTLWRIGSSGVVSPQNTGG